MGKTSFFPAQRWYSLKRGSWSTKTRKIDMGEIKNPKGNQTFLAQITYQSLNHEQNDSKQRLQKSLQESQTQDALDFFRAMVLKWVCFKASFGIALTI